MLLGLPLTQMILPQGQGQGSLPYQNALQSPSPVVQQQIIAPQQAASTYAAAPSPVGAVKLYGDGLSKAAVGQTAQFVIDSKGSKGDLSILVEGNGQ